MIFTQFKIGQILPNLILIALFFSMGYSQNENPENLPDADSKSQKLVQLTRQGKFKEALPLAKEVVDLREKEFGEKHTEVARALRNLGFVHYFLGDYSKAEKTFSKAGEIYELQTNLDPDTLKLIGEMYKFLALSKHFRGETEDAFPVFQKSIELYDKSGGQNSLESAEVYVQMGNIRSGLRDFDKAAEEYRKSLEIRFNKLGREDFFTQDAFDRCVCVLKKDGKSEAIQELLQKYYPTFHLNKYGMLISEEVKEEIIDKTQIGNKSAVEKDILNGKAIRLPRPVYPRLARNLSARSRVFVHTKIDEQGEVSFACGAFSKTLTTFIISAEEAAYRAGFEPTRLDGKPIRVSGIIEYRFN